MQDPTPAPLILGFDLRHRPSHWIHQWSPERRCQYLLNPETPIPLSVDPGCWPSLLNGPTIYPELGKIPPWLHLPPTPEIYQSSPPHIRVEIILIAVAIVDPPDRSELGMYDLDDTPRTIDPSWIDLGFDVADEGLTSGLCNCGLNPDEQHDLRQSHGSHLNQHGLFKDAAPALTFRDLINDLVPEHAPFQVFQLFEVPDA